MFIFLACLYHLFVIEKKTMSFKKKSKGEEFKTSKRTVGLTVLELRTLHVALGVLCQANCAGTSHVSIQWYVGLNACAGTSHVCGNAL